MVTRVPNSVSSWAKVADGPHVATVFADGKPIRQARHTHEPILAPRNRQRQRGPGASATRQKAYEQNDARFRRLLFEAALRLETEQVFAFAKDELRCDWQF